nr:isopeptide-forming domain-containing fimbrial protein [uncultured Acetatifactor sp.]
MKRMKKIVSLALALMMVFAMATTAFAADNHPHKIIVKQNSDDKTSHTYEAYQIFAGDLAEVDGKKVLSNIIWGSGVNGDELLGALKKDSAFNIVGEDNDKTNAFANCTTASQVAEVLSGNAFGSSTVQNSTLTDAFARVVENNLSQTVAGTASNTDSNGNVSSDPIVINVTGSGYYLVKDRDQSVTEGGAYSRFMLEVVGDATATVKSEVPSGDKKVYIDDVTTGDANNASIGSHVSYQITSKVPNHVGYNYYYFIMNDTLSEGLTFDGAGSVTVTVGGETLVQDTGYYVYTGVDVAPKTFRLAFNDIRKYTVGAEIVVTYSATINDKAIVGTTGNPNTWNLQYSNNPDDTFDGERPDGENTPGLPADEQNEALGQTPDEKTLTYVTELDITKYANSVAEDHPLAGAEFTLTGTSKQVVLNEVDYYEASKEGTYYLLLDGTYTETAPTGTKYVEIGVGTAETTTGYIKNAAGEYVVPKNKGDYVGQTLYKLVKGTAEEYADVNTKYMKKTATETTYVNADVSIEMTTGEDGKISFKDLGAGEYILTETVTPEGFNTLDPIKIVITFEGPKSVNDGNETCTWKMTWNGEEIEGTNGIFAQNVINQSGSLLPSTGGIGTTIFYVVGGILVIGAGILLVAKKRMSNR